MIFGECIEGFDEQHGDVSSTPANMMGYCGDIFI
jgi:hypothetical protein